MSRGILMTQTFTARVWKEDSWFIAQCAEVDVASHGRNEQEALELYLSRPPPRERASLSCRAIPPMCRWARCAAFSIKVASHPISSRISETDDVGVGAGASETSTSEEPSHNSTVDGPRQRVIWITRPISMPADDLGARSPGRPPRHLSGPAGGFCTPE